MKVQELMEMAKRASVDDFYNAAKKKYGAAAVKDIKWSEVVALARELDVTIPAAAHKNKTGRGRVNLVPDDHADTKAPAKEEPKKAEPKKEEPKAEPKKEEPKAAAKKTVDFEQAANNVLSDFKRHAMAKWSRDSNRAQKNGKEWMVEIRDWGTWQNPDDKDDEEDYDWQEPTAATRKAYQELAARAEKDYGVKVSVGTGEKNWLEIYVGEK